MDKETSSFHKSPEIVARLLSIGDDTDQLEESGTEEHQKAELLRDWLAGTLPPDPAVVDPLPVIQKHVYLDLLQAEGKTLGDMLLNPKTQMAFIEKIKDYGKIIVASAGSTIEKDAAVALYYGAIAQALVYHGRKISQYSYTDLAHSFSVLIDKPWISADLKGLYERARQICQNQK